MTALLISCDPKYAKLYAPAFFQSCMKAGQRLHFNVVNPDNETGAMQRRMAEIAGPDLFECSVLDGIMDDPVAYTFCRFIVVRQLLEEHPERVGYYTVDVDSIVLKPLPEPDFDLGLWLRPEEPEVMKVLASLCYFGVKSLPFLERAGDHFAKLPASWFADQIALHRAYQECASGLWFQNLRELGQISWEQEDFGKAAIHQGKGPRKKRPFFIDKINGLSHEFSQRQH